MTSPNSANDRTPAQGQGVGLSVQQASSMTIDQDLDGLIAAVEEGIESVPRERVAGYLSRLQADVARLGLRGASELSVTLGRLLQAVTAAGDDQDPYALLPELARDLPAAAEQAPPGLADRLHRLAAALSR